MKTTEQFFRQHINHSRYKDQPTFKIKTLQELYESKDEEFGRFSISDQFRIIWIIKGTGISSIDLVKRHVNSNSIFFVRPGELYRVHPDEKPEGYVFSFYESFLAFDNPELDSEYRATLFNMFVSADPVAVSAEFVPDMKNIAEKMMNEFAAENLFRMEILRRYLKILMTLMARLSAGNRFCIRRKAGSDIVMHFLDLLETSYKCQKTVAGYAARLSVTPNHLNALIKKTTGFSAGHHIRQRIVLEAKRQAVCSGRCMKEIAYDLGFYDMAHFSKLFKNTTGINFTEFKKKDITGRVAAFSHVE